jgi:pentatricopeptide repeat protein
MLGSIGNQRSIEWANAFYQQCKSFLQLHISTISDRRQDYLCIFNLMIGIFCKENHMQAALQILKKDLPDFGLTPDITTFHSLLSGYIQLRPGPVIRPKPNMIPQDLYPSIEPAESIFDSLKDHGISPDLEAYNILFYGFAIRGQGDKMTKYYKQMREQGIQPDETTSLHLATLEAKLEEQPDAISNHFKTFLQDTVQGQSSSELEEVDSSLTASISLTDKVSRHSVKESSGSSSIAKEAFFRLLIEHCRRNDLNRAEEVYETMKSRSLKIGIRGYVNLVAAAARAKDIQRAYGYVSEMKREGIDAHPHVYHALMNLQLPDNPQACLDLYYEMKNRGIKDTFAILELVFEANVKLGNLEQAEQIIRSMALESKVKPPLYTYFKLIHNLTRNTAWGETLRTPIPRLDLGGQHWYFGAPRIYQTDPLSFETDSSIRTAAVRPRIRPSDEAKRLALLLFEDMIKFGHTPSRSTFYHLITAFMTRKEHEDVLQMYKRMWPILIPDVDFRILVYSYFLEQKQLDKYVEAFSLSLDRFPDKDDNRDWMYFRIYMFQQAHAAEQKILSAENSDKSKDESTQDGPAIMLQILMDTSLELEKHGHNLSPSVLSDALHFCGLSQKNWFVVEKLWLWMVQKKRVSEENLAYYVECLLMQKQQQRVLNLCTDWVKENCVPLTAQGLAAICDLLQKTGLGILKTLIQIYWEDHDLAPSNSNGRFCRIEE